VKKCLIYFNFDIKWNLLISYNPKFIEKYYKALYYIAKVKDELQENDLISFFTYTTDKLKRSINRKKAVR
jgi:hypothetical protein